MYVTQHNRTQPELIQEEAPCNLGMAVRSDEAFCSGRLMRPQIEQERESLTFVQMCLKFSKRYPALCNSQISLFMMTFFFMSKFMTLFMKNFKKSDSILSNNMCVH
jgi:hypothetical protein